MQFARRFSIPIAELSQAVTQIGDGFNLIARKYGMPMEARMEFATLLQNLKLSRPMDVQLNHAGGISGGSGSEVRRIEQLVAAGHSDEYIDEAN